MRFIVCAAMAMVVATAGYSSDAAADSRLNGIIGTGVGVAIGGAILNEINRKNGRVIRRTQQRTSGGGSQGGRWGQIAAVNGEGTTVCNTSDEAYACFALRCGKGRGTEFAFLSNSGDYGTAPSGRISVDGQPVHEMQFTAIDAQKELVVAQPDGWRLRTVLIK